MLGAGQQLSSPRPGCYLMYIGRLISTAASCSRTCSKATNKLMPLHSFATAIDSCRNTTFRSCCAATRQQISRPTGKLFGASALHSSVSMLFVHAVARAGLSFLVLSFGLLDSKLSFPDNTTAVSDPQGQPGQPSFRYSTTANYLAQLTGHDLNKQCSQGRSSLPVEQLNTSMQHRHLNGGPQVPPPPSSQADLLAYPSSSLVHFQQLLQAQAAANGFAPPQLEAHIQAGMSPSAALQAAQHAQQAASQQHLWLPPKGAATLAPPSDKSNPDPGSRHPSRSAAVSPSRYRIQCINCSTCITHMFVLFDLPLKCLGLLSAALL